MRRRLSDEMQVLRLRLALIAPNFAQDDGSFAEKEEEPHLRWFSVAPTARGAAAGDTYRRKMRRRLSDEMQVLRLRLALIAPNFAQDDGSFAEKEEEPHLRWFSVAPTARGAAAGDSYRRKMRRRLSDEMQVLRLRGSRCRAVHSAQDDTYPLGMTLWFFKKELC